MHLDCINNQRLGCWGPVHIQRAHQSRLGVQLIRELCTLDDPFKLLEKFFREPRLSLHMDYFVQTGWEAFAFQI